MRLKRLGAMEALLLCMVAACLLTAACKAAPKWSAESRSPDGRMIATAEAFMNGGFAAPGPPATFVYLRRTSGSAKRVLVFAFSEGAASVPAAMEVRMTWLTPTHLELTYKGQHTVDFEAVEYAGVTISVEEAPR